MFLLTQQLRVAFCLYFGLHSSFLHTKKWYISPIFFFCLEHSLDLLLKLNDPWLRVYIPTYHQFHWLTCSTVFYLLLCAGLTMGKKWACVYLWRANVLEIKCRQQNMAIDCEMGLREGPWLWHKKDAVSSAEGLWVGVCLVHSPRNGFLGHRALTYKGPKENSKVLLWAVHLCVAGL